MDISLLDREFFMNNKHLHNDTPWTKENYKTALKMTTLIDRPTHIYFDSLIE